MTDRITEVKNSIKYTNHSISNKMHASYAVDVKIIKNMSDIGINIVAIHHISNKNFLLGSYSQKIINKTISRDHDSNHTVILTKYSYNT